MRHTTPVFCSLVRRAPCSVLLETFPASPQAPSSSRTLRMRLWFGMPQSREAIWCTMPAPPPAGSPLRSRRAAPGSSPVTPATTAWVVLPTPRGAQEWRFAALPPILRRRQSDARARLHPAVFAQLAERQQRLLTAAAPLVRPGGLLVYATCSLEPEENEQVVE